MKFISTLALVAAASADTTLQFEHGANSCDVTYGGNTVDFACGVTVNGNSLTTEIADIKAAIATLQTDVGTLQTGVGVLQGDVIQIQTAAGTLGGTVNLNSLANIANANAIIAAGTARSGLATDISDLNTADTTAANARSALQTDITANADAITVQAARQMTPGATGAKGDTGATGELHEATIAAHRASEYRLPNL
jgi:hypothetical protein